MINVLYENILSHLFSVKLQSSQHEDQIKMLVPAVYN